MKRITILTIATILLVFAGVNVQELIQKEQITSKEIVIQVSPIPTTDNSLLTHTFVQPNNKNSTQNNLTLQSIGSYNEEFVKSEQTTSKWNLSYDDTILQISTNPSDSSPFGVDLEPEVTLLNSRLTAKQIYRVKVDENFYFYTNSYFNDSCGHRYCSNGLLSTDRGEDLSIYCVLWESSPDKLSFCDQIVENLKDRNV